MSSCPSNPAGLLRPDGPFGVFADELLADELPDMTSERRGLAVTFVCRRVDGLPSPLAVGVRVLTVLVGIAQRVAGSHRVTSFLQRTRLPLVGELARMVRSLAFAYVWETWPDTTPSGAAA